MIESVIDLNQEIIDTINSDLFFSKKETKNYKILFVTNNKKHKIAILDPETGKDSVLNIVLDLEKNLKEEHITTAKFMDFDNDGMNEIVIGTDQGNIFTIDIIHDKGFSCNTDRYELGTQLTQLLAEEHNQANGPEGVELSDSEKVQLFLDLLAEKKIEIDPTINDLGSVKRISCEFFTCIDRYLLGFDFHEKSLKVIEIFENIIDKIFFSKNILFALSGKALFAGKLNDLTEGSAEKTRKKLTKVTLELLGKSSEDFNIVDVRDSANNVIITTNHEIICIDGDESILKWRITLEPNIVAKPLIDDIDGDGFDEIVAASKSGKLYVISHDGKIKWLYDTEFWNTNEPLLIRHKQMFENEKAIMNTTFDGKIFVFGPHGILNLDIEPSSAIMLDYGLFDLKFDSNDHLIGDVSKQTSIDSTIIDNFNLNDNVIGLICPKGKIYLKKI